MSAIKFERHITKFELTNQCILAEDDKGNNGGLKFNNFDLLVRAGGKSYKASVREFYLNGKFKNGIAFDHEKDHLNDFFFDQSVSENKRVRFSFDGDEPMIDGRHPIDLEVYVVTK
jgi:hypothetical protein